VPKKSCDKAGFWRNKAGFLKNKAGFLKNKAGFLRKIWQKTAKNDRKRLFFCVKKNEKHSKTEPKNGLKGPKNRLIFNVPDFLSV